MNSNLDSTSTKSSWVVFQVLFFDHSFFLIIKVTPKNTNQQEALRFSTAPSKKIARNPDRNGWVKVKPAGFAGRSRILRCIHSYSLYRFLFCIYIYILIGKYRYTNVWDSILYRSTSFPVPLPSW